MGGNVQCPVCTLFLLPGMDLSDHLETHPKEQVIKALVQLSLKSEVGEIVIPDNPIKAKKITSSENSNIEHGSTTPTSEITSRSSSLPTSVEKNEKRNEPEDNSPQPPVPQNLLLGRQSGYLFDNNSSSSSSSSSNYFGPPTTYYHPHQHESQQQQQQHQQQQQQQQQQHQQQQNQSQQHHHNHLQNYHPLHNHLQSGSNATISQGPPQPPLRLFSYQQQPKPLQPPPAYGAAISQLRSQNSQNQMGSSNVNRPMYSPGNYIPSSSTAPAATSSRLAPPLPPPPLNQRYQPNFPQIETCFNDTNDNSDLSPKRTSMTPPIRPPPQLYRSPLSSGGQYSRQSNSPYSAMAGSPSVLRFAESPVTAHYLERENGDFIVQETPKHVVECVEKDNGEFSVIERVYHMPPSVVQINEDQDDDMSEAESISEDMKTEEDDRSNGTWAGDRSPEERQISQLRAQKKSAITVLSDVQLDLNEYLDLMGNIIASGKVAKTRTELIKIEKFEPEEDVKDELGDPSCLTEDVEDNASLEKEDQKIDDKKKEQDLSSDRSASCSFPSSPPSVIPPATDLSITPGTTSVIRLAANPNGRSNTPTIVKKVDETTLTTGVDISKTNASVGKTNSDNQINKADESVQSTSSNTKLDETIHMVSVGLTKVEEPTSTAKETEAISLTADTVAKVENETSHVNSQSQPQADHIQIDAAGQINQKQQEVHIKEGKQLVKENPPAYAYIQSVKRPFKKVPKKLVIKPKSKDSVTSQFASQPQTEPTQRPMSTTTSTSTTTPTSTPTLISTSISISTPTPTPTATATSAPTPTTATTIPAPAPSPSSIPSTSTSTLLELQKEIRLEIKDNNVKVENVSHSPLEKIPPPLLADTNEKLPPDDEVQPSTSNPMESEEEEAALPIEEEKPTTDLSAFLDQCMKKEEVEERPMHSIFGMEIDDTAETLDNVVTPPAPNGFPSASLFSKPLASTEHFSISEIVLPNSNDMQEQDQNNSHQSPQQQQNNSPYVEYPFSFLYSAEANHQEEIKHNVSPPMYCSEDFNKYSASTSNGNSASCTWYQSQSSENDFEIDGKGSYLDLDSCKRSVSFAAATEGSMPTADGLNIRTDEKMPAKGEISEQESNCGVESSWSQPLYNEFPVLRFPNPYQNFMTTNESWSQDHYFRPQDLSSSTETKNFGLRLSDESPAMDTLPSTSKRKNKMITKVPRKKSFQCAHCNTNFPLLKEKNAHLIKQHGYKRVNRRLIRDPPTSTVTTATMNTIDAGASLLLGLEPSAVPPPTLAEEEDSKAAIVKIEQENQEQKDCQKGVSLALTTTAPPTSASISRTKYDSMRARDNRMLINFNLNALNVKNEGEAQSYYMESKSSFCCFVCRRDFLTVKLFDEHLTEHPAECFTCHKKFTRWKNFMVHLKRHLGWKDFGCTFCEKKFVIRSALVEHMRMHTGLTPLKCKICGKSFKRYSNLTQHRKRHGTKINRTKEYVCYCGEVLPSKARFIWHKETHDLKPKCCPYCRDRFVHANSLRRHIRLAHSDKFDYTEPMECPMCKQIYAKSSIKAHMATHSMDTQHECLICNKSFSTKWNLKIHNWVHANRTTKPFKCDQCVKAFVREVDYNNHMNSHKQIKPYTCEHCGCKFIRKYNYIRHRREHHGNKKFTCDICGKLFHRHYYLIEHRRIHTGERPFQCTICGKSSTTKTNHNKHLKIHHSRDPFTSEA